MTKRWCANASVFCCAEFFDQAQHFLQPRWSLHALDAMPGV